MVAGKKTGARASKFARSIGGGSPQIREAPASEPEDAASAVEAVEAREARTVREKPRRAAGRGAGARTRRKRPEKPVRITVDLDPDRHRRLKVYALEAEAKGTEVIRALLDEMDENPGLAARIRDRLAEDGDA